MIAKDVADLHGANNLNKQTALNEKGEPINGRGDTPNIHDILTGSQPDGTAFAGGDDRTCGNWTKSGAGAAMVGHHDRMGLNEEPPAKSWNSSHPSRGPGGGCAQDDLEAPAATACSIASRQTRIRNEERRPGGAPAAAPCWCVILFLKTGPHPGSSPGQAFSGITHYGQGLRVPSSDRNVPLRGS